MYDGLNDYQKKFVSKDSWKKFEELEARLKELIKANGSADGSDKTDKSDKAIIDRKKCFSVFVKYIITGSCDIACLSCCR